VVGNEMDLVLASRGLPPLSNIAMMFFIVLSFINGIALVLLYAIVKEHLGAGIRTSVIVSLVFWFLTYFLNNVSLIAYGFMPVRLTVIGTIWGLAELLLAGIVGSKLYKEVKQK
jgi:phage-related minor tail protein